MWYFDLDQFGRVQVGGVIEISLANHVVTYHAVLDWGRLHPDLLFYNLGSNQSRKQDIFS
jgi:hypothetical protein